MQTRPKSFDLSNISKISNMGKISKSLSKEASAFFNNINEIILPCY